MILNWKPIEHLRHARIVTITQRTRPVLCRVVHTIALLLCCAVLLALHFVFFLAGAAVDESKDGKDPLVVDRTEEVNASIMAAAGGKKKRGKPKAKPKKKKSQKKEEMTVRKREEETETTKPAAAVAYVSSSLPVPEALTSSTSTSDRRSSPRKPTGKRKDR